MKKTKGILCLFLCIITVFSTSYAVKVGNEEISSQAAILIDYETGNVLYSYNENKMMSAASLTKLMTMYVVYEKIHNGEMNFQDVVPIKKEAYNASRNYDLIGNAPLNYNEKYTVDELVNSIWVNSLNAAAIALAQYVSGSEYEFVKVMNEKCVELGLNAKFVSSHGAESENKITPESVAKLAKILLVKFPEILNKTKIKSFNFHGYVLYSTNKLLSSYPYDGADGLKTGTTKAAGYCFCGTAERNGKRIIGVTMKSSSTTERFSDVIKLLNYGFDKTGFAYATDIRTFINENEVPTFIYDAEKTIPLIICEDLSCYGFDVSYDHTLREIKITKNEEKKENPIPMEYYKQFKKGTKLYKINNKSNIKVFVIKDSEKIKINDIRDFNGYVGISADEIAGIYGGVWDNSERSIKIS